MEGALNTADQAIIAGFFLVMLGIGFFFSSRMKTLQDYFTGSRSIPWWLSGASLYMSTFSAFTFVAYSEIAFKYGFVAVTIWWIVAVCVAVSAWLFASRWRRAVATSPLEFIEVRYNTAMRQGLAFLGIPLIVIDDGLKLYAIGNLLSLYLGYDLRQAIIFSGSIMLAYTFLGGLWAVLITDFVQFAVLLAAVLVLVPFSFQRVGGMSEFFEGMPPGFMEPIAGETYKPWFLISFSIVMFLSYSTRWSLVQRYYSVRTDKEARKVGYFVAIITLIATPILFFPAMAARVYDLPVQDTKNVYGLICRSLLPIGMLGMMIAAMFSATMSMLSSDYNATAAVITNDVYKRLWGKNSSDRTLVWVGRLSTLVIGLIALGIGLLVEHWAGDDDLFKVMADLASILIPPIGIPMLVGLISRKVSPKGALVGFTLGVLSGIAGFYLSSLPGSFTLPWGREVFFSQLNGVAWMTWITSVPTLVGMYAASFLLKSNPEEEKRIDEFISHVEAYGKPEALTGGESPIDFTPLSLVGYAIGILGAIALTATWVSVGWGLGWVTMVVGGIMVLVGLASVLLQRRNT
ncbi:MAG: sodium/solute symporter, partial [Candidatus Omnitrophica bacterium]|nr:sodium/solute symporter [Candidatus Omnitrophota bacterium]